MTYIYDVFVSYRRHREWTPWTREHLYGLLDAYLTPELGKEAKIFVDDQIEPGADWPNRLAGALSRTRVLLPVFSRDYFDSEWCVHELDLMHGRAKQFPGKDLIIPVIGHDGELVPVEIARIQSLDLKAFRNTDIQRRTPRFEQFSESVKGLAPHLRKAIESVPPFDEGWLADCQNRFDAVYQSHCGLGPTVMAKTLTLKLVPHPVTPPRVTL